MKTVPVFPIPAKVHGVSLICRREGRFLLVERGKEPWKGWLAFPGGSIELGETSEQAAIRELKEETALDAKALSHVITVDLALEGKRMTRAITCPSSGPGRFLVRKSPETMLHRFTG